jgi:hypothetical protein
MLQKSWRRNLGWTLVGDGIAGLTWPRRYLRALEKGRTPAKGILEALSGGRSSRVLFAPVK